MGELESAKRFWNSEVQAPTHNSWMAHPLVREYINRSIAGPEGGWPLDWFQRAYPGRTFRHGLSIGCGTGALERDLLARGICESLHAVDASDVSLTIARNEAEIQGLSSSINYFPADFNELVLPRSSYDIVFFHQSLHHVSRMERLLSQVRHSLRPGGLIYLDEFIGPSRTYWSELRIAWYRALYQLIPREFRYFDEFAMPIQYDDLSEAIRSGEIMSRLDLGFHIQHVRGYGGNILAMMFPDLHVPKLPDELVAALIDAERSFLASGVESFHAIIVAAPKTGTDAMAASLRYLLDPKLKRLVRDARRISGRPMPHASEEDRFRT